MSRQIGRQANLDFVLLFIKINRMLERDEIYFIIFTGQTEETIEEKLSQK